jgi:photosystem II stability/assembly factor-like uncharacterized protein
VSAFRLYHFSNGKPFKKTASRSQAMKLALPTLICLFLLLIPSAFTSNTLSGLFSNAQNSSSDSASQIVWTQTNGPPGGWSNQLVQSTVNHNELFLSFGQNEYRLYRSIDKGAHWQLIPELANQTISSIISYAGGIFIIGGFGLKYLNQSKITDVLSQPTSSICISDNKIFLSLGTKLLYSDLTLPNYMWKDISLPQTLIANALAFPPDPTLTYGITIPNIVAEDQRLIANIILIAGGGGGQYNNGELFQSDDLGATWSVLSLGTQKDIYVSNIVQDPNNPRHLILTYRYNMVNEVCLPLKDLTKNSFDGGKTWVSLTNEMALSNGISDAQIVNNTYYFVSPWGGSVGVYKIDGSSFSLIPMPILPEFPNFSCLLNYIAVDFDDSKVVYGNALSHGLLISSDGMQTWKRMDNGLVGTSPYIVLAHPTNSSIIFDSGNACEEKYMSLDNGNTWIPSSPSIAENEIKVDPFNPNHIIVVDETTTAYESFDLGKTYSQIQNGFYGSKIYDFQIPSGNKDTIYASTLGVGISKYSSSTGWQNMHGSPDYCYALQIDPTDSNVLYAACSPKIFENDSSIWKYSPFETQNFGWTQTAVFPNTAGITSLTFDPSNPNKIYAGVIGSNGTIYQSNDHGVTWKILNKDLTFTTIWGHSQLQIDPRDKNTAYAGTWGGGTYKTNNAGQDWTLLDSNQTFSPTWIAISESNPNVLYACDRLEAKIHRSDNSGQTWYTYYDFGKNYLLTGAVAIDPTDSNTIYASAFSPPMAHEGSFIKIKNGAKVLDMTNQLPRSIIDIQIDKNNPNTLYVTTHIYGVFKSTDGGLNWIRLDDNGKGLPRTGFYDIEIDPTNSNLLYATALSGELPEYMVGPNFLNLEGNCGVYQSKDGGDHWTQILQTISEARGIAIDPKNPQNLYVADMAGGVWASNNGGKNWRQENSGLGSISMTSVKVKDDQIYASTQGSGVYSGTIQNNGSIIWDNSKSNKPKAYVSNIQVRVDPSNSQVIYAAGYPGGLLRSDNAGLNWNDKNFLTPSVKVDDPTRQGYYAFDIDPSNSSNIWLGTYGKGLFVSHDHMDYDVPANGDNYTMANKHIKAIRVNPNNSNEVYVGSEEGVFVTRDGGHTWYQMSNGLETRDVRSLKLQAEKWLPFYNDFEDRQTNSWNLESGWTLATDGTNHYLQGIGHFFASSGDTSWSDYTFESKIKLTSNYIIHVNFRMSSEGRYLLGFGDSGLYLNKQANLNFSSLATSSIMHSTNQWHTLRVELYGGSIKIYVDGILEINYLDLNPISNGAISYESLSDTSPVYVDDVNVTNIKDFCAAFIGTGGYGVYRFNQQSNQWQNTGRTLGLGWWSTWERRMYQFSSIVFDPNIPGRVYLGHFPGGFFISQDGGHSWQDSSVGLGNDGIFSLMMDPTNSSILWAGTYNGASVSLDGGKTWQLRNNGMPPQQWPFTIAVDSRNPNIMYSATKNGLNKGINSRNQFLGVVMKSTDGGQNWFKIMNGLSDQNEYYKLIIYPLNHNVLFLSSSNGVFLSEDAGSSWKPINTGLPSTINQVRDNVANNLALTCDNKTLLLGLFNHGIWKADLSQIISLLTTPTPAPTVSPTPTLTPTPTASPIQTLSPTTMPTDSPQPTTNPTQTPTNYPTNPIQQPTNAPSTTTKPGSSPSNATSPPSPTPAAPEFSSLLVILIIIIATSTAVVPIVKNRRNRKTF